MRLCFGEYVLDVGARQLLCRGRHVPLSPKAFQLLQALLENRPRALSKQELQRLLWPDAVVVEANLSNLAADLRAALKDEARAPRFVRTVQRFGYAFCGEVREPPAAEALTLRLRWPGGSAELGPGEHVIGRDPEAAVSVASASVSRRHAIVRVLAATATLEDLGSKNGTYLNGASLQAARALADGDEVCAGSVRLKVRFRQRMASTETAVTGIDGD